MFAPQGKVPLKARRALVIGGSGGIGRAVAEALAARGASIVLHGGSSEARLQSALARLGGAGAAAKGFLQHVDESPGSIARMVEAALAHEPVDFLVVAFGPFLRSSLSETSTEDWTRIAALDLALPGALVSAFLPRMAARGWGRILLFGGTRTDVSRAFASNAAYAAAKSGLGTLVKSVAAEGAAFGVACLAVCPGLVDTEYLDETQRERLRAVAPRGDLIDPASIAEAALGLLCSEPCAASGAIVTLDNGLDFGPLRASTPPPRDTVRDGPSR